MPHDALGFAPDTAPLDLPITPDLATLTTWVDRGAATRVTPWLPALRDSEASGEVLLASRALRQLGADRAADALTLRLGRRQPGCAEAQVAKLRVVLGNRGTYAFWHQLERTRWLTTTSAAEQASWLSLKGYWLTLLRDNDAALALQREALALDPREPWLWVEHAYALSHMDRREDALDAARHALSLSPGYRTAILQAARLLQELQRPGEARALLEPALQETGGAWFAWQLHTIAAESDDHAGALQLIERAADAMPLAEAPWGRTMSARRADLCLALGRLADARSHAAMLPAGSFHARLVERLDEVLASNHPPAQRTLLPLAMVQQHWMTCAPATLTALANYWGRPADHLEVAQAICYDGTPQPSERGWAEQQGFQVRECTLDWPTACALVNAGVPFALTTQYVASGHLQAVVGFDPLRGTLLVRDPSQPVHAEYEASMLFDHQQSGGPRAMVMLPPSEAHRLAGIDLPDTQAREHSHALLAALQRHDRPAAESALTTLQRDHAGTDIAWRAARSLAAYDGDETRMLAVTEALLERFPDDRRLHLSRLASLNAIHGQLAADSWLGELVARKDVDVELLLRWSRHLSRDARRLPLAMATLRQALRRDGCHGGVWSELGTQLWQAHGMAAAMQPLRWASSLQPTEEWSAAEFARGTRVAGEPETGLDWLRARVATWGDRSGKPATTLADALDSLQRGHEAEAVLDAALQRRPNDNDLRLAIAERRLTQNRLDEADALLAACTDAHAPVLLRLRARLDEERGDLHGALACVREAVALEPLQVSNHRTLLRLLRRVHGDAEALTRWRPLVDAYPAHVDLQHLLYDALPDEPAAINAQLAHMQRYHPDLPWLKRELAVQAARQNRHDEAVALAETALEQTPRNLAALNVLGFCAIRRDGHALALPRLQAAVALDAESDDAVLRLLDAPDPTSRRAAMDFWASELTRQVLLGDGLLALQRDGIRGWTDDEVLTLLCSLRERWPAHWQGLVAEARQRMRMQQPAAALALLDDAAARFPQLPRVHYERADALRLEGRFDEAVAANGRTLALSPGWNRAVRLQVDLLGRDGGSWPASEQVVQQAVGGPYAWNDADLIGLLAWLQEQQRRDTDALATARRALLIDPHQAWVWAIVRRICERAESPAVRDGLIDEVVRTRPGDAEAWLVRAEHSDDDRSALAAAEQAIALQPRHLGAWEARLQRLTRLERFDDAERLLEALPWPAPAPLSLRVWGPQCQWLRGRKAQAIEGLRALCAEAPEDEALCVRLADWLDESGDHAGYLAQARTLMTIAPHEARSLTYLGHALSKNDCWAEALPPLQRAIALVPNYVFAARVLSHAARRAGQPAQAEPALQALWPHLPGPATASDGVEAAAAAGNWPQAQAWLQRLMSVEQFDIEHSLRALAACREAGWEAEMTPMLYEQIKRGRATPGIVLDRLRRRRERLGVWITFLGACRLQRRAEGPNLLLGLLRWIVECRSTLTLMLLQRMFEPALRAHHDTWGEVSYALVSQRRFAATRRWMSDWRSRDRERTPAFALANLAGSLAVLGRWSEQDDVVNATLARVPVQEDMRLWQLLGHARRGDLAALDAGLARCHEWRPDDWMKPPLQALRAFAALARERAGGDTVGRLRRLLGHAGSPQALTLQRELGRLARRRYTPWTRLWQWARPT